jgi:hypothetical protein
MNFKVDLNQEILYNIWKNLDSLSKRRLEEVCPIEINTGDSVLLFITKNDDYGIVCPFKCCGPYTIHLENENCECELEYDYTQTHVMFSCGIANNSTLLCYNNSPYIESIYVPKMCPIKRIYDVSNVKEFQKYSKRNKIEYCFRVGIIKINSLVDKKLPQWFEDEYYVKMDSLSEYDKADFILNEKQIGHKIDDKFLHELYAYNDLYGSLYDLDFSSHRLYYSGTCPICKNSLCNIISAQ